MKHVGIIAIAMLTLVSARAFAAPPVTTTVPTSMLNSQCGSNVPVLGGGTGSAPTNCGSRSGSTTTFGTTTGTLTSGHVAAFDSSGNIDDGGALGTASAVNTGTSGATIPLNNGGFTQSGTANFTGTFEVGGNAMTFPGSAATLLYSGGALGTPASGTATNLTGTASGLTAGHVTTNANLTGDVTSVGNATTLATVSSTFGADGGASSIPTIVTNAKGLVTSQSSVAVVAPAGTLSGTTLNSTVVNSSLTSVGTLAGLTVTTSFTATGLVTNTDLANSSMTIAGHSISLGGTQAIAYSDLSSGAPTATASVLGLVKPDGTTITISGGVITAVGAATTSIDAGGATAITNGASNDLLYDNAGNVGHKSVATTSQIWSATANSILDAGQVFNAAGALQALTGTTSVTPDFSTGFNFSFTATSADNYTLNNPTNMKFGQSGCFDLFQPATGTVVTIAFGADWYFSGGTAPTLTATLGAEDLFCYWVKSSSVVVGTMISNIKP